MSSRPHKSKVTSTSPVPQGEDLGTQKAGQDGKFKNYAWLNFGEIVVGDRVFKHGDPVLLCVDDAATQYLTCLDPDIKSPDADE